MENNEVETIEQIIEKSELFDFDLIKNIVSKRNIPLSRNESIELIKIIDEIYSLKISSYDEYSVLFISHDFVDMQNMLHKYRMGEFETDCNKETKNSLQTFFGMSSKIISDLLKNPTTKPGQFNVKIPPSKETALNQEASALLFITLRKLNIIHSKISKKDLATLAHCMTGYGTSNFVGTYSDIYKIAKDNPDLVKNIIQSLNDSIAELSKLIVKK